MRHLAHVRNSLNPVPSAWSRAGVARLAGVVDLAGVAHLAGAVGRAEEVSWAGVVGRAGAADQAVAL